MVLSSADAGTTATARRKAPDARRESIRFTLLPPFRS
jgi:hypothetical protein